MAAQACWGRGSASRTALLLWLGCALWCWTASAATLTVGGASGWTTNFDYASWAANQTFALGDVLFFPYAAQAHDVAVVNKAGYDSCTNPTNGPVYTTGNTNVTLNSSSSTYYICTISTHCSSGKMKLAVTVGASNPSSPTSNSTGSNSSAVPSVTSTQLGYFAAILSALLAGFML